MEPVFMILGQSSGIIASIAIDGNKSIQDLKYNDIKTELEASGQILK
jgi:hypothetical protein